MAGDRQGTVKNFLHNHRISTCRERHPQNWTWGYMIYRTVYTPESDEVWESILSKLTAYMFREIDEALWYEPEGRTIPWLPPDPSLNAEVREHLQNTVMDDREKFDGLSMDQVRQIFRGLLGQPFPGSTMKKLDMFLMIDEEVLHSIKNAPEPTRTRDDMHRYKYVHPFVKAVSMFKGFAEAELPEVDDASMKASINALFALHTQTMDSAFPRCCDPETVERDMYEGQPCGERAFSKVSHPKPLFTAEQLQQVNVDEYRAQIADSYAKLGIEWPEELRF